MTVEVKKIRTTWVADDIKNMFALFFCFFGMTTISS